MKETPDSENIREAKRFLAASRVPLQERPTEEIIDVLARVFDSWRDPATPWRVMLEASLPEATGFHPHTVKRGLEDALASWTGDAFRAMAQRELGALAAGGAVVSGHPLTSVILGGAIPMPSLLAMTLPLLLRSPVLAKSASRDPITAPLVAASIAAADTALGRCVVPVSCAHDDEASHALLLASECVVATGSDETIAAIASRLRGNQRLVAYGHRLSVAVIGRDVDPAEAAAALALDIARWDQLGCLSPLAVYALGSDGAELARALDHALAAIERVLPRGALDNAEATRLAHARSEAELRAAADDCAVHGGPTHTVVCERDTRFREAPAHRFVRVHPVRDLSDLDAALAPVAANLAGVALAGVPEALRAQTLELLTRRGASRVCQPGALQTPPLGWHHDGQPLLAPMARIADLESRPWLHDREN